MKLVSVLLCVSGIAFLSACGDVKDPVKEKSAFDWCAEDLSTPAAKEALAGVSSDSGTPGSSSSEGPAVLDCSKIIDFATYDATYKIECTSTGKCNPANR
jgi:hypothetical protein